MDSLTMTEKRGTNYILYEPRGVINSYTFSEFRGKVYDHITSENVVIDLADVTGIDSSGIGVLMGAFNDGEEYGHTLYLMRPSGAVYAALNATGFTDVFRIIHSVTEVL